MKKFNCDIMIHLADSDASGVIFFPKLFEKCLIALECFLEKNNFQGALVNGSVTFPVVHAHAHYYCPIKPYEKLKVELSVTRIGQTSVSFIYKFINSEGLLAAEANLVHVCVDAQTRLKKMLSEEWIQIFSRIFA